MAAGQSKIETDNSKFPNKERFIRSLRVRETELQVTARITRD